MGWYRKEAGAVVVTVRLTPKADRDAIVGIGQLSDGSAAVKARVRAVPEDGAANAALVRLIAKTLRVPKSSVEVVSGRSQRLKQVRIRANADELARLVQALAEEAGG